LARLDGTDLSPSTLSLQVSAYLRAFPEEAQKLPTVLPGLSEKSADLLMRAMVSADTAQAEGALLAVLSSSEKPADQVKVLRVLGTATLPSVRITDALFATLDATRSADSPDASWEAAMSAARALSALGARPSPQQGAISSGLQERLKKASTPRDQKLLLQSLRGCEPPPLYDDLLPFLQSPVNEIRAATAELLASLSDPRATEALDSVLAGGTDELVRRAALSAMSDGPVNENRSLLAMRLLAGNPPLGSRAREELVRYLAKGMQACPQNRERLKDILKKETSRPVIVVILNALNKGI
jgi:hypothetical protein